MTDVESTVTVPSAFAEIAGSLPPLVTPDEFEGTFHVPVNTQNDWRSKGKGPKFMKLGRTVYYKRDAVLDWLRSSEFSSTAQAKAARA